MWRARSSGSCRERLDDQRSISIVDGACSTGFAGVRSGRKTAVRMATILESQVLPRYREAGIAIRAINTDGGPEFGRHFRRACQRLESSIGGCRRGRPT